MAQSYLAILIYGEPGSRRNALSEEKYKDLADSFSSEGYIVESILYNDSIAEKLLNDLLRFQAVLVWVNPIEQGKSRKKLDSLLREISNKGCFVSAHPDVILKIGTKEVLFTTRAMDWGTELNLYRSFDEFKSGFPQSLATSKKRVLKQYRGNGGNGVYKVLYSSNDNSRVKIIHANGNQEIIVTPHELYTFFQPYFLNDGMLIDQQWNENIANGMVRCYLSGNRVAGFGYQEINALYERLNATSIPPSKRYYFTEQCGIFRDLKEAMETKWVPQLQETFTISDTMLPIIWDADFFIGNETSPYVGKYTLCEINVSCVSPFPPSSIKHIVKAVGDRINT